MLDTPPPIQHALLLAENLYPAAANGKGTERCYPHKNFNGGEYKYKLWIRMVEAFIRANRQMFTTPEIGINFALSYMNEGKDADWTTHFINKHMQNKILNPDMTWEIFKKLLEKMFHVRRTEDKAQINLAVLKHKSGELEKYILDFDAPAT